MAIRLLSPRLGFRHKTGNKACRREKRSSQEPPTPSVDHTLWLEHVHHERSGLSVELIEPLARCAKNVCVSLFSCKNRLPESTHRQQHQSRTILAEVDVDFGTLAVDTHRHARRKSLPSQSH